MDIGSQRSTWEAYRTSFIGGFMRGFIRVDSELIPRNTLFVLVFNKWFAAWSFTTGIIGCHQLMHSNFFCPLKALTFFRHPVTNRKTLGEVIFFFQEPVGTVIIELKDDALPVVPPPNTSAQRCANHCNTRCVPLMRPKTGGNTAVGIFSFLRWPHSNVHTVLSSVLL